MDYNVRILFAGYYKLSVSTLGVKKLWPRTKKIAMLKNQKMGGQWQRSDSADGNKILIITIQATKCY